MANKSINNIKQWLEDLRIGSTEEDLLKLNENIEILKKAGLRELNKRLFSQTKRFHFLSTLTEHNFTANLLKYNSAIENDQINYEPNVTGCNRPPDLHVRIDDMHYWIQIKRFSQLKFRNIQNKIYDEIENRINSIKIPKFIDLQISTNFDNSDIESLIKLIGENAHSDDEKKYIFNGEGNAEFYFRKPNQLKLNYLTFGMIGDIGAIKITGLARDQIKSSMLKAIGAFKDDCSKKNLNFIVAESDGSSHDVIDLCEALYGTEYITFDQVSGKVRLHRDNDGLYNENEFTKKIAGVIVIRRKHHALVDDYWHVVCSNPNQNDLANMASKLISVDKIVDKYSGLGKGFFDLDKNTN